MYQKEEGASAFKCIKDSPPIPMNSDSETTPTVLAAIPQIKQTDIDGWYEVVWGSKCYRVITYEYYPGFEPIF